MCQLPPGQNYLLVQLYFKFYWFGHPCPNLGTHIVCLHNVPQYYCLYSLCNKNFVLSIPPKLNSCMCNAASCATWCRYVTLMCHYCFTGTCFNALQIVLVNYNVYLTAVAALHLFTCDCENLYLKTGTHVLTDVVSWHRYELQHGHCVLQPCITDHISLPVCVQEGALLVYAWRHSCYPMHNSHICKEARRDRWIFLCHYFSHAHCL